MGKQKQQIISRFFAPKPKPSSPPSSPPPSQSSLPNLSTPPPKISATVTFSPLKRLRTSQLLSPVNKPPKTPLLSSNSDLPESSRTKLSPHTQNPIPHLSNPTLHEKFLNKLLEPSHEDRRNVSTSNTIVSVNPKYTPLEQQVVELKAKYKDVLLMVEVGYKFRFFGQDAENAARVLGIFAHMDHNFLTASIPTFRLNFHVRRLVSAGYKVGVVKQTETATIKAHGSNKLGPFCRGLSALYTKATLEASEDVGEGDEGCGSCNSYLVCVVEKKIDVAKGSGSGNDVKIGIVAVEISTGDVIYGEFDDNLLRTGIEAKILSLSPAELLIGDPLSKLTEKFLLAYAGPASNVRVERVSRDRYADGGALAEVLTSYDRMGDSHLNDNPQREYVELEEKTKRHLAIKAIMAMPDLAVQALALTIDHLKQFGFERILCLGASFRPFSNNVEMTLSANAIQQLEVLKNNSDGSESGSLLERMNHTLTISGSRLLRHWVSHPLRDRNMINARLDAISEILESMGSHNTCSDRGYERTKLHQLLTSVLTNLGRSPDIQRGITRIFHRTATALEGNSFGSFKWKKRMKIATARNKVKQAKEKLDLLIGLYRKQLRNQKLEFTTVSGTTHLIELPQDVKVPSNWVKVNSTKKAIRYHAPEVLTALDDLSLANEELLLVCRSTWQNFLNEFGGYYSELQVAVQALAALDCLHSLALLARNKDYIRPVFVDDSEPVQICVSSGRHPVMETMLQDSFVPNDTSLHADGEYCQIVTGPNMGGKSCYIRQVALLAIMAQVGSFVPASSAKLHVLDGIYTRMGASDSIQQGRSTFLEELGEASHILESCTGQSLVILDELGRGTSTHDGVAIAYATLQYLLEQKRCMVLFVTHYPEIVKMAKGLTGCMGSYHVSYLTSQKGEPNGDYEDVVYLYKLVPGVSERSFGFKVAQLAQLPLSCINRASVMAMRLEDVVRKKKILQESGRNDEAGDMEGYKEMFSNLNLAAYSQDIDPAKSFECLKTARSLALELINRSMTEFMMAN
ncbi:DNA mismatch repair protein MSH3 isoform X4 [Cynara cardunculus var. scolymus]|uniref:DNA mismatch repair protein MSH3 isoform X4 n=1 Tax=Cynara cardunculus var. scolymus TaxID=59895 RepID=UPI000D629357|nr:DNA mismatch repair protein MSH3 isoform X4 [Cynara cardunculus var. scolymus]